MIQYFEDDPRVRADTAVVDMLHEQYATPRTALLANWWQGTDEATPRELADGSIVRIYAQEGEHVVGGLKLIITRDHAEVFVEEAVVRAGWRRRGVLPRMLLHALQNEQIVPRAAPAWSGCRSRRTIRVPRAPTQHSGSR